MSPDGSRDGTSSSVFEGLVEALLKILRMNSLTIEFGPYIECRIMSLDLDPRPRPAPEVMTARDRISFVQEIKSEKRHGQIFSRISNSLYYNQVSRSHIAESWTWSCQPFMQVCIRQMGRAIGEGKPSNDRRLRWYLMGFPSPSTLRVFPPMTGHPRSILEQSWGAEVRFPMLCGTTVRVNILFVFHVQTQISTLTLKTANTSHLHLGSCQPHCNPGAYNPSAFNESRARESVAWHSCQPAWQTLTFEQR